MEREAVIGEFNEKEGVKHIFTINVETCHAIVGFNGRKQTGFILHATNEKGLTDALNTILKQPEFVWDLDRLEVKVIGGTKRSGYICCRSLVTEHVFRAIESYFNHEHKIAVEHLGCTGFLDKESYIVGLNLETGKVRYADASLKNNLVIATSDYFSQFIEIYEEKRCMEFKSLFKIF